VDRRHRAARGATAISVDHLRHHTRADGEDGRTELIRATVVGRNAPVTAALAVATAAVAVTGVLIALIMLSMGLPVEGSLVYGAAIAAFGIFFA